MTPFISIGASVASVTFLAVEMLVTAGLMVVVVVGVVVVVAVVVIAGIFIAMLSSNR